MTTSVGITGIGARTPLGLQPASAAAAVRAGISSLGYHPFMIDRVGDPMPGALDHQLDPALMGPERMLALAESALRDACMPLSGSAELFSPLPVYVALPEFR